MVNLITSKKQIPAQLTLSGLNHGLPDEEVMIITSPKASIWFDFLTSSLKITTLEKQGTPVDPQPSLMKTIREVSENCNAWEDIGMVELGKRIRGHFVEKESIHDLGSFHDGFRASQVADAIHRSGSCNGEWIEVA